MKWSIFVFVLSMILVFTWTPIISDPTGPLEHRSISFRHGFQQSYDVHSPIVIANNTDFEYQAQLEGWVGNGTQSNPYIIEGLLIDRSGLAGYCIDIRSTTIYFEIRNCHLTGATVNGYAAIYLGAVSNGKLTNNNCSVNYYGIYANGGGYNTLYNNTCRNNYNGIYVRASASPTVSNNNCSDNSLYGIYLWGSATTNGVIQDNLCLDNGGNGIDSYYTHDTSYINNTCVINSGSGIHINIGNNPFLLNNTCNWNGGHGIHLDQGGYTYHYVRNNTCSNNSVIGIYAQDWTDGEIIKNLCWDNSYGIRLTASDSVIIRNNTLNVHNIGISIDGSSDGNTFNWNAVRDCVTNYAIDDGTSNNFNYNFWSNYTGTDSDMDGYGDTPYSIDGTSMTQDSYPSIFPPDLPPIAWIETPINQVISEFDVFYYDLNATLHASLDTWHVNDTNHFTVDSLGVVRNSSILDPGMYGIQIVVNDSYGNYLIGTFSLLVLDFTQPSWIEEPTNRYFRATDAIIVDLDAFDISGIDTWWISDETNFIIDENGVITNVKSLPDAIYPIQVWVNDTSGNTLSAQFNISVDHSAPYRHAAIYINGDADFLVQNWSGAGTLEDPYIIEYLEISPDGDFEFCIEILNTQSYFIIRDCLLIHACIGIRLYNVTNALIENNLLLNNEAGIELSYSSNNDFLDNLFDSSEFGLYLWNSNENRIDGCSFSGGQAGMYFYESDWNEVTACIFNQSYNGLYFNTSSSNTILMNTFLDFSMYQIVFCSPSNTNNITWNIFNNTLGFYFSGFIVNIYDYNFWLAYAGVDDNADGYGDTPYYIPGGIGHEDSHPLMYRPYHPSFTDFPEDQIIEIGTAFQFDCNVYSQAPIWRWWIDDELHFNIDTEGILTNTTFLEAGEYVIRIGVENIYKFGISSIFVLTIQDTTSPIFVPSLTNQMVEFGSVLYYDINAHDWGGIDQWWINDTIHFSIDSNGHVTSVGPLPVGVYGLRVWVNDTHGNLLSDTFSIEVQDTLSPEWIETPTDQFVEYGTTFVCMLNATDLSGIDDWWIDDIIRFTIDWTGTIRTISILPPGSYGIQVWVSDIYGNELSAAFVVDVADTTPPEWVVEPVDQFLEYGEPLSYQLNVFDLSTIDAWSLNDTENFHINTSGLITNIVLLDPGQYSLQVSVSDEYGNTLSSIFTIHVVDITTTPPPPILTPEVIYLLVGVVATVAITITLFIILRKRSGR